MDRPGNVANPSRVQLNRENEYFSVRVRAWKFGLARRVRRSRPASACLYLQTQAEAGNNSTSIQNTFDHVTISDMR